MKILKNILQFIFVGFVALSISGCGESSASGDPVVDENPVAEVEKILLFSIPEDATEGIVGESTKFEAWAVLDDGSNKNISDTVQWTTSAANVTITLDAESKEYVLVEATDATSGSITVTTENGISASKNIQFVKKTIASIEIQEGYCGDGNCPVITGNTVRIPIVDDVNYEPVSIGAYYPTAWLVFTDGSKKQYINSTLGIRWWSANQIRAYVNTVQGSFVFGRGLGTGIEISVSYRGDHTTSFFVDVYEDTSGKELKEVGIVNTKDLGWGCSQDDGYYGQKLSIPEGDSGKYLQACGKFKYADGSWMWEDINNNVAWTSEDREVVRVRTTTGELRAFSYGDTVINAQVAGVLGKIEVLVISK